MVNIGSEDFFVVAVPFAATLSLELGKIMQATAPRTVQTAWVKAGLKIFKVEPQLAIFLRVGHATMIINGAPEVANYVIVPHLSQQTLPKNKLESTQLAASIDMCAKDLEKDPSPSNEATMRTTQVSKSGC